MENFIFCAVKHVKIQFKIPDLPNVTIVLPL